MLYQASPTLGATKLPVRCGRTGSVKATAQIEVRPYTIRDGDTLSSIASKRGFTLDQLTTMNPGLQNPETLVAGETILIPAGKLSDRDREIISGLQSGTYRLYPVREGESIDDIISKRNITMEEIEALNPTLSPSELKKLKGDTLIKLPAGRYTVREREMLQSIGAPREYLDQPTFRWGWIYAGAALLAAIIAWNRRQSPDKQ